MNTITEYTETRDKIEAVAALANAAVRGAEHLDMESSDSLTDSVRLSTAESIWSGLIAAVERLDR